MNNELMGKPSFVQHLSSFMKTFFEEMPLDSIFVENIVMEEDGTHQININRFILEKSHPTEGQEQPSDPAGTPPVPQNPSGAEAAQPIGESSTSQEPPNMPHRQEFVLKYCDKTTPAFAPGLTPQQIENLRRPPFARREGAVTRPRARKVQRMTGSGDDAQTQGGDNLETSERSPQEIGTQTPAAPERQMPQANYKLKLGNIYFGRSNQ